MNARKISSTDYSALTPTIFIIFGITGDLAGSKLLPALLGLYVKKELPERFAVVGVSRRHFSREELREYLRGRMNIKHGQFFEEDVKHFLDHVSYEEGKFDSPDLYKSLAANLKAPRRFGYDAAASGAQREPSVLDRSAKRGGNT